MNTQSAIGFRQLFDHETWTFTYLLWDLETSEGVIIDPVRENFERDFCLVGELGLHMVYALDTHVHADHITSLGMLQEKFGLQTAVGEPSGIPCAAILLTITFPSSGTLNCWHTRITVFLFAISKVRRW